MMQGVLYTQEETELMSTYIKNPIYTWGKYTVNTEKTLYSATFIAPLLSNLRTKKMPNSKQI
jgi:hypothetical protein